MDNNILLGFVILTITVRLSLATSLDLDHSFLRKEMVRMIDEEEHSPSESSWNVEGKQFFPHDECRRLLEEFSQAAANYTLCGAKYARPVNLCLQCKHAYLKVIQKYDEMEHYKQDNVTCKEVLTKQDKLNIVTSLYNFVTDKNGIWAMGNCQNCYNGSKTENSVTEEASKYVSLLQETWDCFYQFVNISQVERGGKLSDNNNYTIVCGNCSEIYLKTRQYFWENLVPSNTMGDYGAVCIDLKDAFNFTGYMWGIEFQCNTGLEMGGFWILILIPFCVLVLVTYGVPTLIIPFYYGSKHRILTLLAIPDHYDRYGKTFKTDVSNLRQFIETSREDGQEEMSTQGDDQADLELELFRLVDLIEKCKADGEKEKLKKLEENLFGVLSEMRKYRNPKVSTDENVEPFVEQLKRRRINRRGQSYNQPNVKWSLFRSYLEEEEEEPTITEDQFPDGENRLLEDSNHVENIE